MVQLVLGVLLLAGHAPHLTCVDVTSKTQHFTATHRWVGAQEGGREAWVQIAHNMRGQAALRKTLRQQTCCRILHAPWFVLQL